jgi:hypothetical protein
MTRRTRLISRSNAIRRLCALMSNDALSAELVEKALAPTLRSSDIVIMDNLGSHRASKSRQALHRGPLTMPSDRSSTPLTPVARAKHFRKRRMWPNLISSCASSRFLKLVGHCRSNGGRVHRRAGPAGTLLKVRIARSSKSCQQTNSDVAACVKKCRVAVFRLQVSFF